MKQKSMREKILKTVEAYYITNNDVLSDEELKELESQIKILKKKIVILI